MDVPRFRGVLLDIQVLDGWNDWTVHIRSPGFAAGVNERRCCSNYQKYEDCDSFVYLADLSDPNTDAANLEATIDAGTYVTVIDNTDCGDAQPPDQGGLLSSDENDRARVDYRITAQ